MKAGEKMRELRGKRSKREIAEALGISLSSYVKYERGERTPKDSLKKRIAEFFGVTVSFIFFD